MIRFSPITAAAPRRIRTVFPILAKYTFAHRSRNQIVPDMLGDAGMISKQIRKCMLMANAFPPQAPGGNREID